MWVPSSSSSQRPPGRRKVFFMNCGTKRYSGHFRVSSVVLWYLRFAGSKVLCLNAWIIVVAVRNRFCLPGYFRAFRISRQVLSCCDAFSLLPKGSDCCSQANCVCVPRSCLNWWDEAHLGVESLRWVAPHPHRRITFNPGPSLHLLNFSSALWSLIHKTRPTCHFQRTLRVTHVGREKTWTDVESWCAAFCFVFSGVHPVFAWWTCSRGF